MHLLASSTQRNLGMAIAVLAIVGFAVYLIYNVLWAGRAEKGSELELAPNRKPYLSDEDLETKKLDFSLATGLVTLVIIGVALPLYWLGEPGRQEGYVNYTRDQFTSRGFEQYEERCASCHGGGGLGGTTATSVTDDNGNFVAAIQWEAPALTTVLYRFSEEEVRYILNYGRPPTPMQAWGAPGGGPLTTQQVDEIIQYIQSIQLSPDQVQAEVLDGLVQQVRADVLLVYPHLSEQLAQASAAVAAAGADESEAESAGRQLAAIEQEIRETSEQYISDLASSDRGELLFNNGEYGCARCHTPRESWIFTGPERVPGEGSVVLAKGSEAEAEVVAALGNLIPAKISGGGAFGSNLTNGSTLRQFDTAEGHAGFIMVGSQEGVGYGNFGQGDGGGQMPAFGVCVGDRDSGERSPIFGFCTLEDGSVRPGLLTEQQIADIVAYEREM
ncbi:MAG: cytochrome c [Acidimicrobiia bacterium]|nr:cytochrome c [Acidimicrobiia bacterium]MYC57694.1 cytochrome c [Acidimicrobiia bacterium]MYG93598.1 cytochrome c [Acidimicrobiia bacterium]